MGRPLKLVDPFQVEQSINTYLDNTTEPTLTGMCKSMGISYHTFQDALERKDAVSATLKKGLSDIASVMEHRAVYKNSAGSMYWLKAILGWVETRVIEQHQHNYDHDSTDVDFNSRVSKHNSEQEQEVIH